MQGAPGRDVDDAQHRQMGGLIIGMITRTALGHTGRPVRASRLEVAAYTLITATTVRRVLLPVLALWILGTARRQGRLMRVEARPGTAGASA